MNKIANMFGIGNLKFSGTITTLLVAPLLYVLKNFLGWYFYTAMFLILLPFAIKWCGEGYQKLGDSPKIVLDEVVGFAVMLIFAGKIDWFKLGIGFVLFRVLDILKPWPISIWQKDKSEVSVVADDMLAGIIAGLIVGFI